MMKRRLISWSRRYGTALRAHLLQSPGAVMTAAQRLGREAVVLGVETLEMARIHDQALAALGGVRAKGKEADRSGAFFIEANHPIEETHLTAREARRRLEQLNESLQQHTSDLADSHQQLKRRIVTRKSAEEELRRNGHRQSKLLKESAQLQDRLRILTHRLLAAQESERAKIGRGLRDEIAQTLLGINVRLLSLKTGAGATSKNLQKEIVGAQKLVASSARVIHRVARGIEKGS